MLQQLRIISGKWRSRKITFLPLQDVRPTLDATRETLFNWLGTLIIDAICLDLFAGSGALGFEALSRGAKHVVMLDASAKIINQLKKTAAILAATDIDFICAKLPQDLKKIPTQKFNLVFLDPPFAKNLIKPCSEFLEASSLLASQAYIYIEAEKELAIENIIPKNWQIIRNKISGQVRFCLCSRYNI